MFVDFSLGHYLDRTIKDSQILGLKTIFYQYPDDNFQHYHLSLIFALISKIS